MSGLQGNNLGAYKLARMAFDKLGTHRIPSTWLDVVDLTVLTIQSKPFSDKEVRRVCTASAAAAVVVTVVHPIRDRAVSQDLLPYCYRCSSTNPLVSGSATGDACVNCGHQFVRSFATFDPLPLVRFLPRGAWYSRTVDPRHTVALPHLVILACCAPCRVLSCPVVSCRVLSCPVVSCRVLSCPVVSCRVLSCRVHAEGISDDEAVRLINLDPLPAKAKGKEDRGGGADVFTMGDDVVSRTDPFDELLTGVDVRRAAAALCRCPLLIPLSLSSCRGSC